MAGMNGDSGWNPFEDEKKGHDQSNTSMFCNNEGCPVVEHLDPYCPVCKQDESGRDCSGDDYEAHCESLDAERFEEWAHGGQPG